VTSAIEVAARRQAAGLRVAVERNGDALAVQVDGTGDDQYIHPADRVGALGGHLIIEDGRLRAEIPCGWSWPRTPC